MIEVKAYQRLDALPQAHRALLGRVGARVYALSEGWFDNLLATALDEGDEVRLLAASGAGGEPLALLALRRAARGMYPGCLESLATMYTCEFDVVSELAHDVVQPVADALALAVASDRPVSPIVRLDSFDPAGPWFGALRRGLHAAGLLTQPFVHFGCWHESLAQLSLDGYLARRPGRLRNTLKRKARRLQRSGEARFAVATGPESVEPLIADYEQVHARSWKPPEPYPDFVPGLIRRGARDGAVRLGVLYRAQTPIAAQLWVGTGGRATIFKLSYDQAFERDSPGALLTLHMIEQALAEGCVERLDFGRGDDPYKREWLASRLERWSMLAFNPRTPRGLAAGARHLLPYWAKQTLVRIRGQQAGLAGRRPGRNDEEHGDG